MTQIGTFQDDLREFKLQTKTVKPKQEVGDDFACLLSPRYTGRRKEKLFRGRRSSLRQTGESRGVLETEGKQQVGVHGTERAVVLSGNLFPC